MPSPPIDISRVIESEGYRVEVRPESQQEKDLNLLVRRRREFFRFYRDVAIFIFVFVAIVSAAALSVYELVFNSSASDEAKHWSQTILIALVTGVVSYTFGHRIGETEH